MDVMAYALVRAMNATEWERSQIQGFDARDAEVPKLYIRDCLLPGDQRVWVRPYTHSDGSYTVAHAEMMQEIEVRRYQKALDWLRNEGVSPAA